MPLPVSWASVHTDPPVTSLFLVVTMTLLMGTEAVRGSKTEALRAGPAPWEVAGSPRTQTSQEALQKPKTIFKHQIQSSRHPIYHPYHLLAGGGEWMGP